MISIHYEKSTSTNVIYCAEPAFDSNNEKRSSIIYVVSPLTRGQRQDASGWLYWALVRSIYLSVVNSTVTDSNFEIFDQNPEFYADLANGYIDSFFIAYMEKHPQGSKCLDIGGASGRFALTVKKRFPMMHVAVVDPSITLLNDISSPSIQRIVGYLPDSLNTSAQYDYVSVNDVLHHICGRTQAESKELARLSLLNIQKILAPGGALFLHELYYESYIRESLTRSAIFRALRLQNRLGIKVPVKEFLDGLLVNFYSRRELLALIQETGYKIVEKNEHSWSEPRMKKKLLFIKDWGDIFFVLKKK